MNAMNSSSGMRGGGGADSIDEAGMELEPCGTPKPLHMLQIYRDEEKSNDLKTF